MFPVYDAKLSAVAKEYSVWGNVRRAEDAEVILLGARHSHKRNRMLIEIIQALVKRMPGSWKLLCEGIPYGEDAAALIAKHRTVESAQNAKTPSLAITNRAFDEKVEQLPGLEMVGWDASAELLKEIPRRVKALEARATEQIKATWENETLSEQEAEKTDLLIRTNLEKLVRRYRIGMRNREHLMPVLQANLNKGKRLIVEAGASHLSDSVAAAEKYSKEFRNFLEKQTKFLILLPTPDDVSSKEQAHKKTSKWMALRPKRISNLDLLPGDVLFEISGFPRVAGIIGQPRAPRPLVGAVTRLGAAASPLWVTGAEAYLVLRCSRPAIGYRVARLLTHHVRASQASPSVLSWKKVESSGWETAVQHDLVLRFKAYRALQRIELPVEQADGAELVVLLYQLAEIREEHRHDDGQALHDFFTSPEFDAERYFAQVLPPSLQRYFVGTAPLTLLDALADDVDHWEVVGQIRGPGASVSKPVPIFAPDELGLTNFIKIEELIQALEEVDKGSPAQLRPLVSSIVSALPYAREDQLQKLNSLRIPSATFEAAYLHELARRNAWSSNSLSPYLTEAVEREKKLWALFSK